MKPTKQEVAAEKARRHNRKIAREITRRWPDAYQVPGVGWCGPDFEAAAAFEAANRRDVWAAMEAAR